jgi:hypothetical protein
MVGRTCNAVKRWGWRCRVKTGRKRRERNVLVRDLLGRKSGQNRSSAIVGLLRVDTLNLDTVQVAMQWMTTRSMYVSILLMNEWMLYYGNG